MTRLARARVLKASSASSAAALRGSDATPTSVEVPRAGILPPEVHDAKRDATRIIDDARAEAARIEERAVAQGEERARHAEHEAREAERERWRALFAALERDQASRDEQASTRILTLARVLAEHLIGEELRLSPTVIAALARRVLEQARGANERVLLCHPNQVSRLESMLGAGSAGLTVRGDASLAAGDLRLETDVGSVEGSLRRSLERLAKAIDDAGR